jgi:hypothetical protein
MTNGLLTGSTENCCLVVVGCNNLVQNFRQLAVVLALESFYSTVAFQQSVNVFWVVTGRGFLLKGELRKPAFDIVEVATNNSIQQDDDTRSRPNLSTPHAPRRTKTHQRHPDAPRRTKEHQEEHQDARRGTKTHPLCLGKEFYLINKYIIEQKGLLSLRHQE